MYDLDERLFGEADPAFYVYKLSDSPNMSLGLTATENVNSLRSPSRMSQLGSLAATLFS
jgi:hypothetical protein